MDTLRIPDERECEELCRKRVYLEKMLRGIEVGYERCLEICRAVAKLSRLTSSQLRMAR
jgi:hypothetical protein